MDLPNINTDYLTVLHLRTRTGHSSFPMKWYEFTLAMPDATHPPQCTCSSCSSIMCLCCSSSRVLFRTSTSCSSLTDLPSPITSAISRVLWCFSTLRSFCAYTTTITILLQMIWCDLPYKLCREVGLRTVQTMHGMFNVHYLVSLKFHPLCLLLLKLTLLSQRSHFSGHES